MRVPTRALLPFLLLLFAAHVRAAPQRTGELTIEHVGLEARLDPAGPAIYAQANLVLRNRGRTVVDLVELSIPAPLGARASVRTVWDRHGELAWRFDPPADASRAAVLLVALRDDLSPGKKRRIVVSYELQLAGLAAADAAARLSSDEARLATTGWFPAPQGSEPEPPERLRLTVRLPADWHVWGAAKLKRVHAGEFVTSYEMNLRGVEAGEDLFRARAPTALPIQGEEKQQ